MKYIRVKMTEKQLNELHESATKADMNASELIRHLLVEHQYISDVPIEHGGYRERKKTVKKKE